MTSASSPAALRKTLEELAFNLWWGWQPDVTDLFRSIDPARWERVGHNPIALLQEIDDELLAASARDQSLVLQANIQARRLAQYIAEEDTWATRQAGVLRVVPAAYFSAEFGVHESLPLYSGGLGILAADYLKSASDLGLPIVGVGLFYAHGYFHQRIDPNGWQQEVYGATDVDALPLRRAAAADGAPLVVEVLCGPERVKAAVWLAHVGRARLLLLDCNLAENAPTSRELTARLYGGDELTRIRQEIVLGIGGLRALRAIGMRPIVLHLNEGHSAFALLERVRERVQDDGLDVEESLRLTAMHTVFTTHTPVEAGHDRFGAELVESQLGWMRLALGLDSRRFMALGRIDTASSSETFCMTVLAMKGARVRNAVSDLHGDTARPMWRGLWPGRPDEEVPIGHITNGVHAASWLAAPLRQLFDRYLGADWLHRQANPDMWSAIAQIGDGELWNVHGGLKRRLLEDVARRSGVTLDPSALTIGFARRFATYKRATLPFSDTDRLARLASDPNAPIQFLVAGKAHPRDDGGKGLIQQIVKLSKDARFAGRLVFLEDYDIGLARLLVQGVDVWLNTPLRPLEACGTSGQKAALNGVLNASVLDGWWAEAFDGLNGFAIGSSRTHRNPDEQWKRDAERFYRLLEGEIQPLFYDADLHGVPVGWVERMKRAIETLAWRYNADRMVIDYATGCYLTAAGGRTSSMASR